MSKIQPIKYYNRISSVYEIEKVYGDAAVKWLYQSFLGKTLAWVLTRKWLSFLYGLYQSTSFSAKKVPVFINEFQINMNEYKAGSLKQHNKNNSYATFNEFFIREFEDGKRSFTQDHNLMPAFAEARYVGFESINDEFVFPVKGKFLRAAQLLGGNFTDESFSGGPLMIARLCPVDYHRYHYPDNGRVLKSFDVHGDYHSVNPIALKAKPDIFLKNERRVSILETENFGKLAFIEVGAICVGKIVQTHNESHPFYRGQEKGYFLFGGSTVIVIGEKGKWKPSTDILANTQTGIETYTHLGSTIAALV